MRAGTAMVLAVAVLGFGLVGVGRIFGEARAPMSVPAPAARVTVGSAPAADDDGGSLYDLGINLIGADGARHRLGELAGHPVLASMFFASCPSVCPVLISQLQRLDAQLPRDVRDDARVLLVSFDPARDTPAVLADVVRRHGLDARRWSVMVAASEDDARTLAAALAIRYRAAAGGMFNHTARVVALDRQGRTLGASEDLAGALSTLAPLMARAARDR
jgi:protein SCO1/2